jgi:hypothetical protein
MLPLSALHEIDTVLLVVVSGEILSSPARTAPTLTDGWASNHFSHLRRAKVETKLDIYRNHARAIGHPSLLWSLVSVKTIVRIRCARVAFSQIRDELL